jgi:hypothetical protein
MKNNLIIIFICFIIIFVTGCDNESNKYSTAIDNSKNITLNILIKIMIMKKKNKKIRME